MTRNLCLTLIGSAAALLALPALAQAPAPATETPAAQATPSNAADANRAAMQKMHAGMMIEPTGDADVDFIRGMIPHHQGAIDMARIQLQFGDDPEARRMAQEIIAAQEAEIAAMQDWLQRNAPETAAAGAAAPAPKPVPETVPAPRPAADGTPEPKPAT